MPEKNKDKVSQVKSLDDRLLVSIKEAARLLSVQPLFILKLAYKKELRSVKLGRRRLIPYRELERLIKSHME